MFDMFSFKSLSAQLTFPLLIFLNVKEIFSMFIPFSLIFILSWIVSPSCNKLVISASSLNFKHLSSETKWSFWLQLFTRFLEYWSNNTGMTCITLSAVVFSGESWIQSFKRQNMSLIYFFPTASLGIIYKLMYNLFVCVNQILFDYCSMDLIPEVGFMIPVSVRVVAVTIVIICCYVVTVINCSIRIDILCFSFCKNSDAAVICYWFWTFNCICCSWHMFIGICRY